MRLLLATDAWQPQINGVVRTLNMVVNEMRQRGHEVDVVNPTDYPNIPMPGYPEIRLAWWLQGLAKRIELFNPDAVHIATEGPIGFFVRRFCLKNGYTFTTSFHTRFPEYLKERAPVPMSWSYALIRRFHQPAFRTLVPTKSIVKELEAWKFAHLKIWGRGVDTKLFHPGHKTELGLSEKPVLLNVGRVAQEKNLEAFLNLDIEGSKIVVGDGPCLNDYKQRYPNVSFVGAKQGEELALYYASADVFVFPSKTDTFGLVMLESMASGTPVAAFPVTGPIDVIEQGVTGIMHEDLSIAVKEAHKLDRGDCRRHASQKDWSQIASEFISSLMPIHADKVSNLEMAVSAII